MAVLMHGAYDYVLFSGRPLIILLVFPLMLAFWIFGLRLVKQGVDLSPYKDNPQGTTGFSAPASQHAGGPIPVVNPLQADSRPVAAGFCPGCGAPGVEGAHLCAYCGGSLTASFR